MKTSMKKTMEPKNVEPSKNIEPKIEPKQGSIIVLKLSDVIAHKFNVEMMKAFALNASPSSMLKFLVMLTKNTEYEITYNGMDQFHAVALNGIPVCNRNNATGAAVIAWSLFMGYTIMHKINVPIELKNVLNKTKK